MQKTLKMTLKGKKVSGNWQLNRIFMNLKKKLNPGVVLILSWGCICVYDLYSQQVYYISQISGEHLQDHWSSCEERFSRDPPNPLLICHCMCVCMDAGSVIPCPSVRIPSAIHVKEIMNKVDFIASCTVP